MINNIIKLFNIEDEDIEIIDIKTIGSTKEIHLARILKPEYCPQCHSKMHSKGFYKRRVNHPIFQDGYTFILVVYQRKWKCTNPLCNLYLNDQFNFVEKYKQSTNMTPYLILRDMKDINVTIAEVAKKFNVSDTTVYYTFQQYIDPKRLPLPEILSIDEVFLDIDYRHKYAMILMDFITGEIIDILPNRWEETTNAYFLSIPIEERKQVKYLICDMYNPYINYAGRYFPSATVLIDSFHVISWINTRINQHIYAIKKKYAEKDKQLYKEKLEKQNKVYVETEHKGKIPESKETYLLTRHRWVLLRNVDNIEYEYERRYNRKFSAYLNTYDYEKLFLDIDDSFIKIRKLKEKYIEFNNSGEEDPKKVENELDKLIEEYANCDLEIFRSFSELLNNHKNEIINSFTYVTDKSNKRRRLSNGPIEGFNRQPKDYKRNTRGIENFDFVRKRLLWANRENEPFLAVPKSKEEVYRTDEKRKKAKEKARNNKIK